MRAALFLQRTGGRGTKKLETTKLTYSHLNDNVEENKNIKFMGQIRPPHKIWTWNTKNIFLYINWSLNLK